MPVEWSIDVPLLLLMLGFTVWAAVPWLESAGLGRVYAVRGRVASCRIVLKAHAFMHRMQAHRSIRRKRPPRTSENTDEPALPFFTRRH
ncbi:hypothetical protein [Paenibacillus puerhi]|uniref:hypothetical protein n=1 Tax=Paenibacillus puerhi TaxID=2692622 RepID=UPI001359B6F2|nr:hypothetical protein [Paenibacillus puerhi]